MISKVHLFKHLFTFIILSGSIFQFYFLKLESSYFSINFLSLILISPVFFFKINIYLSKIFLTVTLLIGLMTISLVWSYDLKIGIKEIIWYCLFLAVYLYVYIYTIKYPLYMLHILNIYFYLLMALPISIIVFYISPELELNYLHSIMAKIFINPNLILQYTSGLLSNVSDVNKAGGLFFINANVAGAYLGINYFILIGFYIAYKKKIYLLLSLISIVGLYFTGSKAVILIFILLNLMLLFRKLNIKKYLIILGILLILVLYYFAGIIYTNCETNLNYSDLIKTTEIRFLIWDFGFIKFKEYPLTGLGYGGWINQFEYYADLLNIQVFPPHNTMIALWSSSGIIAVICAIIIMYYILKFANKIQTKNNRELYGIGLAVFYSFSWVFIHGMGENFGLFGDEHMKVILATLLGYSLARYKSISK